MSIYEYEKRDGQIVPSHIRVIGNMPDESQEGDLSGPNTNTRHSRISNLLKSAAKRKLASHAARIAASLGFLGGATAAPTAIDVAKAFVEGSTNRVEVQAQSELQQRFGKISISKEKALEKPVSPVAFAVAKKNTGNEIYMIHKFYDNSGNLSFKLKKSSSDSSGNFQAWESLSGIESFETFGDMAAWDNYVLIGGRKEGKAYLRSSIDRGKTFKDVPLPAEIAVGGRVSAVEDVSGTEYGFVNVLNSQSDKSLVLVNTQTNDVKVLDVTDGTKTSYPVVGSISNQGGLNAWLFSPAVSVGENSYAPGVKKDNVNLSRGEIVSTTLLAAEEGKVDFVYVDRSSITNVEEKIFAFKILDGKEIEIDPSNGSVLNNGKESFNNWLRNKYPGSTLNLSSYVDASEGFDIFCGSIDLGDGINTAITVYRDKTTGQLNDYVYDKGFQSHITSGIPVEIGGKGYIIGVGDEVVRAFSFSDPSTVIYLGEAENTNTPTSTATPSPTSVPNSSTSTVTPTSSPTTPTATPIPTVTVVGNDGKSRTFLPIITRSSQGGNK